MRPHLTAIFLALFWAFGIHPAFADTLEEPSAGSEISGDQETSDWLKSWGIKRNPDGSMESMTAEELEEFWKERELKEIEKQARREKLEALQLEQIEHDRELISRNPNDPDIHFQVALNSQDRGDGEGAIIHMLKAEELFKVAKDIRGMARARKALRGYYQTYGYLPEDFDLTR